MHDSRSQNGKEAAPDAAAARWVVRSDRGLTPREAEAFAEWENADPRHRAELERVRRAWNGLDAIGAVPELQVMADDVVERARARPQSRRGWWLASALTAAAALAIGFMGFKRMNVPDTAPTPRLAESVRVIDSTLDRMTLPDGSVAELNGSTRIEVEYSPTERRVRLTEGEAHFVVAPNPSRPFFVSAGPVTVRAVGTAFNVRLATTAIEVLVTEGKVQVEHDRPAIAPSTSPASMPATSLSGIPASPASLVAGQRATIDRVVEGVAAAIAIDEVGQADVEEALGWQTTRLVFNHTPLEEVVAGFNRYNRHQLTLGDAKLRHRSLTGVFRADNLDGFIRLLRASVDVKAEERSAGETVLLPVR
jgi:transmembrane sensor